MNIVKASREYTKVELYMLTRNPQSILLKQMEDGTSIAVVDFLIYEDINNVGDDITLLSIKDDEGRVITAQSPTAIKSAIEIFDMFGDDAVVLKKISGKSKNGRDYVDFTLDASRM